MMPRPTQRCPRFSSTQFRPALQFFAPGEILAPEQTLSFLRRKVTKEVRLLDGDSAAKFFAGVLKLSQLPQACVERVLSGWRQTDR